MWAKAKEVMNASHMNPMGPGWNHGHLSVKCEEDAVVHPHRGERRTTAGLNTSTRCIASTSTSSNEVRDESARALAQLKDPSSRRDGHIVGTLLPRASVDSNGFMPPTCS